MRAVLFDLDGVLVESYAVWRALLNTFARERGYPAISDEAMSAAWGQGVDADARMFFAGTSVEELADFYNRRFADHVEGLSVMPGAASVVARVREAGLATAVVTNTPAPLATAMLRQAEVEPDVLVGGTDVPRPKPAPDGVLRACELLGVAVGAAAMVGDSHFDRQAAGAAGALFVGFRCAGDRRIDALSQLPAALGIVRLRT